MYCKKPCLIALLLYISLFQTVAAQTTTVDFRVNMNQQITLNQFDAASEFVDIAGSFNNWGSPGLVLTDNDADGIYTASKSLSIGQNIELKARINGDWNGREEFANGGSNRSFTIEANGIIEFWYNDEVPDNILQVKIGTSTNYGVPGEIIQFSDLSNGNPTLWEWSFSGGTPSFSTEQNPLVTYASEGQYDVTLTITNEANESLTKTFASYITIGNTNTYWWNDAVFYEIFVRSFYDDNGDGKGDFKGLTKKLDYLNDGNPATHNDLGVTGIWLMPIQQSPSYHGYDATDYRTIEQDYGTNDDFKAFIAAAHERGIKVIVDYVMNHSSNEHPWFIESKNVNNAKRDWYVWKNTNPGGTGPWGQTVWHNSNNDYYYGIFWGGMPDLNYTTPALKTEMFDIATYWLEDMSVDGFRLDAVKYIYETSAGIEDTDETFQFWKDFRSHYKAVNPDAFAVGEAWTSTDVAKKYVGNDGLDYVFEFDLASAILSTVNNRNASGLNEKIQEVMGSYPYLQFGTFLTNHDMNRVMDVLGQDENKARLAAEILFSLPGIPYIYYGEEIGMTGSKPDEDIRLPMQWSNTTNAGFTGGNPWRAPKSDYTTKNIAAQQIDPTSLWRNYQNLIATRNSQIALRQGNYRSVNSNDNSIFTCLRQFENENIIIVSNPASTEKTGLTISLSSSGIEPGSYQLIDLMTGLQENIVVNSSGDFVDHTITSLPAQTTRIYKLLSGAAIFTSIDLMVDMNGMIANESFDPQTEKVILISNHNSSATLKIELSDTDADGIYEVTVDDIIIGSDLEYKYGINEIDNGREEFTNNDFMRSFKLKEGTNQALDLYNQMGTVLAIDKEPITKYDFTVYPNPANDQLNLILQTGSTTPSSFKIIDMSGRMKVSDSLNDTSRQINISSLPNGLYFIQLTIEKEIVTRKFMVNR